MEKLGSVTAGTVVLRPVQSLRLHSTIREAARQMYIAATEAIVVLDDSGRRTLGVVTARDVLTVVAEGLDPEAVTVGQRIQSPRLADERAASLTDIWFS